jgi:hypothetical protein
MGKRVGKREGGALRRPKIWGSRRSPLPETNFERAVGQVSEKASEAIDGSIPIINVEEAKSALLDFFRFL